MGDLRVPRCQIGREGVTTLSHRLTKLKRLVVCDNPLDGNGYRDAGLLPRLETFPASTSSLIKLESKSTVGRWLHSQGKLVDSRFFLSPGSAHHCPLIGLPFPRNVKGSYDNPLLRANSICDSDPGSRRIIGDSYVMVFHDKVISLERIFSFTHCLEGIG